MLLALAVSALSEQPIFSSLSHQMPWFVVKLKYVAHFQKSLLKNVAALKKTLSLTPSVEYSKKSNLSLFVVLLLGSTTNNDKFDSALTASTAAGDAVATLKDKEEDWSQTCAVTVWTVKFLFFFSVWSNKT